MGRPKGIPNKTTKLVKEAIQEAFERLGGVDGLVDWAQRDPDNAKVFYGNILPKLMPHQVQMEAHHSGGLLITWQQPES
jgi:hypothetical protein